MSIPELTTRMSTQTTVPSWTASLLGSALTGPSLVGGGKRVWHQCGAPVSIWLEGKRMREILPAKCSGCGAQMWTDELSSGRLRTSP